MNKLFLADLKEMTEDQIKEHIVSNYSGQHDNYNGIYPDNPITEDLVRDELKHRNILVAYESVGDWGCDSNSFFLFKDKKTKKLYEMHGGHCSCYGFEGQYEPEEITLENLKARIENAYENHAFNSGGYDDDSDENQKQVTGFIKNMK